MNNTLPDLNYLSEYSQRELEAYRNIGTVRRLSYLKKQEIRRRQRIARVKKVINNIFFGILFAFDMWFILSFIDTILHNIYPNPVHHAWNIFHLLFK